MKKRTKTVFPRHIFESLKRYKQIDRGIIYDAIFSFIFDNVPIPKTLTPEQHLACTMFSMDLRRMTTQYENGIKAKKSMQKAPAIFNCSQDLTQIQPKLNPNSTQTPIDIIPYNKYNSEYKYNTNIQSINQLRASARDSNKIEFFKTVNLDKIEELEREVNQSKTMSDLEKGNHLFNLKTLTELVKRVANEPGYISIANKNLLSEEVLDKLLNIFCGDTSSVLEHIQKLFDRIDRIDDSTITNRYSYTLATLVNGAINL